MVGRKKPQEEQMRPRRRKIQLPVVTIRVRNVRKQRESIRRRWFQQRMLRWQVQDGMTRNMPGAFTIPPKPMWVGFSFCSACSSCPRSLCRCSCSGSHTGTLHLARSSTSRTQRKSGNSATTRTLARQRSWQLLAKQLQKLV
ncbi:unnamed protein product [Amoebophrya sp. A25]|nr:unnamed protein product [Amoebophrya sp. A25]|eukprot:GSA25T00020068001.1